MSKAAPKKKKRVKNHGAGDALAKEASKTINSENKLPKPAMGAPTKYQPRFCEMLINHMAKGMSFESFAGEDELNVCRETLYNWRNDHEDFFNAFKMGKSKCINFWEKLGLAGAAGRIKGFKEATYIYNMNNRFREDWQNSLYVSKNPDDPPIQKDNEIKDVTPKTSLEEQIREIVSKIESEY